MVDILVLKMIVQNNELFPLILLLVYLSPLEILLILKFKKNTLKVVLPVFTSAYAFFIAISCS